MTKPTQFLYNNIDVKGVIANGSIGSAGETLHSNGTGAYWSTDDQGVTSVATANGLSGGTITTTGTIGVVTGSTLTVNTSGMHVNTANLSVATSQLTGDVALGANTSGNYVATITAGNGISGSSSTEGGAATIAVVAGIGVASNSTGVHVVAGNTTVVSNTSGVYVNAAALPIATSQLTGDVALGANTSGNYVATISNANGISGSSSTEGGAATIGVVTGSTLTVNTTGLHVNSALSITDLALTGNLIVSGTRTYVNTTTLDVGDNIITLNGDLGANPPTENAGIEIMRGTSANVQFIWDETNDRWSTNSQPLAISSLVAAGAVSGITTLATGNTTITGFANVSTTLAVAGVTTFSGNVVFGSVGLSANGGFGTAGQVLHSNGTAAYWAADDDTTYTFSTGLVNTSGTITVNSAYIATISANNASFLGGTAAASYQLNSTLSANVATLAANNASFLGGTAAASYQLNSTLSANVATLAANNASFLGGTAAASYQLNSTLSANVATLSAAAVVKTVTGTTSAELVRGNMGDNDQARILIGATGTNAGYLEIATADDGTEPIYVRQYSGVFSTLTRTATLLDGSGNTTFPGSLSAGNISTAATANHIVQRDSSGDDFRRYGFADYFNMSHAASGATTDTIFYSSTDNYIRKNNATGFRASLNVPTRTGGDASGTWGISVTGNAATVAGLTPSASAAVANRVVVADGNGYIFNNYFNSTDNSVSSGVTAVMVKAGDNYYRSGTAASIATFISGQTMNISGSATSVTTPTFAGDATNRADISTRVDSGFYEHDTPTTAEGWPYNGSWMHMIAATHSNDANYYSMQIAADFFSNNPFYRSVNNNGATAWSRFALYDNAYSGELRATVFKDNNDTAYYVDPASESVLSTLSLFGELNLSASSINYIDHTGTILFRNQTGYATSASLTTGGDFTAAGNVTAYSDIRKKKDITTIENALDMVSRMRGVRFKRIDTDQSGVGVIAQEMLEVLPEVVQQGVVNDDTMSVAYGNIVGVLIEAIKEQQTHINNLQEQINTLRG